MATHPLLDYTNSYGLRPFLPFSDRWFYGDSVSIIDPTMDLMLLSVLIGSSFIRRRQQLAAVAALVLVTGYIAARMEFRNQAREHLAVLTQSVAGFEKSAVRPEILNPLRWTGIVETDHEVFSVLIDVRSGVGEPNVSARKIPDSEVIRVVARAKSAAVLLDFARFPLKRIEPLQNGYQVSFADFRFYRRGQDRGLVAAAEVLLDDDLRIVKDEFGFSRPFE